MFFYEDAARFFDFVEVTSHRSALAYANSFFLPNFVFGLLNNALDIIFLS